MAHIGVSAKVDRASVGTGVFSQLARIQYAALARMRWQSFLLGLRSIRSVLELGAAGISFIIYTFLGLSLGAGASAVAYSLVSRGAWHYVAIEFWMLCILWQAIAIALASFQEHFDLAGLLRFPVRFGSFVLLYLLFGLFDVSTIIGGLCCLGTLLGITLARPDLFYWALLVVAVFAAFNILLVRAILAWIDRWLAKRRSREIVSALFLVGVFSLQLMNPALRGDFDERAERHSGPPSAVGQMEREAYPFFKSMKQAQGWLPPGLAAGAIQRAGQHATVTAVGSLGVLCAYVLGAGGLLTLRLRKEYRGENLGEAPSRKKIETRDDAWQIGSGPLAAVFEKELRTLRRSVPQLYGLAVPMLMVFIIGNVFHSGISESRHAFQLAFPVCVAYGLLGFVQIIFNNLGGEGKGIQLLFFSPTPIRTVLLGKNLFHATLFAFVALISGLLASIRLGRPSAVVLATTVGWLAFALPANLAAGNLLSLAMPYRVNLGRIGRQAGSQANALLSMLIQATVLGLGAGVVTLCTLFGSPWSGVVILALLAMGALIALSKVLRNADAMANDRRDTLIEQIAKTQ